MYSLTKLKIELVLFTLVNVIQMDFFMEMVSLKQILYNILDSSIKELNIFMEDKSTHMKFMKENFSSTLDEETVSDTHNNMLTKVNLTKLFYMEQENGKMEIFTKELSSTIKWKLFKKLSMKDHHNFMMSKTICFTKINYL